MVSFILFNSAIIIFTIYEEHNKVFDLIGKDFDSLQFLLKDYDKNLNDIIAQQSKIDCGDENMPLS